MENIKTLKPHISLNVEDVERSIEFYCECGTKLLEEETGKVTAVFCSPNPAGITDETNTGTACCR